MTGTRGRFVVRLVLAAIIGVLLGVALDIGRSGGTAAWLARHHLAVAYEARGRLVQAGDCSMYLDCRGAGSPVLVLEAGMGSDSSTWSPVLDTLAGLTRACAYDRIGRGRSDPGPTDDLATISDSLDRLLTAAGERGPYVVVGHSLGATIARVHASRHRDAVVGLVLVDGFDPDVFDERIYPLLDGHQANYAGHSEGLWRLVASVEHLDVVRSRAQLVVADVRGLRIEVLRAARYEAGLDEETNRQIAAATVAGYEAMSPGLVNVTDAYNSGHMVQFDRPDLVIAVVQRLVDDVRRPGQAGARLRVAS